jgi:hypothetical protein
LWKLLWYSWLLRRPLHCLLLLLLLLLACSQTGLRAGQQLALPLLLLRLVLPLLLLRLLLLLPGR